MPHQKPSNVVFMDRPAVLELFHVVALTIDHIVTFIQAQALMVFILRLTY